MKASAPPPRASSPTPGRRRPLWLRALRVIGWLALFAGAGAAVIDDSGIVQREILSELRRRLEPLGHSVELGSVEIDWLGPGVELVDLEVRGAQREHLSIERLYIAVALSADEGLRLARVDLDGGRVLISERAIEDLRALSDGDAADAPSSFDAIALPSAQVRDLAVEFEFPGGDVLPLGSLDLSMPVEGDAPSRISGRFVLPPKPSATGNTEVYVTGLLGRDGRLELHTITDALDLDAWDLPDIAPFDQIEALSPRGRLSLHTTGSVMLTGELEARGDLRVRMEQGSLRAPGVDPAFEDLAFELEATYSPAADEDFWIPGAWEGGGRLSASWAGQDLRAGLRLGRSARPGLAFESWVHGLGIDTENPALRAIEEPLLVPTIRDAFDARGLVDASFGLTCSDRLRPDVDPWPEMELAVHVTNASVLRAAFHGWVDEEEPDVRPLACPLPVEVDQALVVFAHQKRFPRQELLEVRFAARHGTGPATGSYQMWSTPIDMPPFALGFGEFEFDLFIVVPRIEITSEVERHLPELWEIPELGTLFADYGLAQRGEAEVLVRVTSRADLPTEAVQVDVVATGAAAAWSELPVPATELAATVRVLDDGLGATCVSFVADGRLADARAVHVAGRVRNESDDPLAEEFPTRFDLVRVQVDSLALPGGDVDVAAGVLPALGEALAELSPRGRVDLDFTRTTRARGAPSSWAQVATEAGAFTLEPSAFPLRAEDVRGRALLELTEEPGAEETDLESTRVAVRIAPLLARWEQGLPIGVEAEIHSHGPSRGRVLGAGLRPADPELLEIVARARGADPEEFQANLEGISIGGAIDFDYRFDLEGDEFDDAFRFRLRDNICSQEGGFEVDRIHGVLELHGDRLSGGRLVARLGGTPVVLSNVELRPDGGSVKVEADLRAEDISVDAALLRQFLEPEMVTSLVDEFGLRGTVDLERGHVSLELAPGEEPLLVFSGLGTASDAHVALGLPLAIRSARLELERLVVQGDDVRGWGRVRDLYGEAVGRDLVQTDLLLSYYGSQVTVDELDGQFCRGRISGLAGAQPGRAGGPVISVDLHPPYRFQAGLALSDIEVRLLLEDVFASEIADRGYLTGQLSLQGELEDLLAVRGAGWGRVDQTVLWSVPVVRDLFSQLGLDETAVFDEMRSEFHIEGGKIHMEGMRVHSPLLNLEGEGSLGLDGTLAHDLEVRYSLVDKTGPFSSLIYWLQNRLLAISVRGDMSRPKIILRGVFSNPFVSTEDAWRALPAPGFSPLRDRF